MDYTFAMRRHALNVANEFSASQQEAKHGLHHKYGHERFFKEAFLGPMNAVRNDSLQPFSFENEIAVMRDGIAERDGIFILGVAEPKFVQIPDRFRDIF